MLLVSVKLNNDAPILPMFGLEQNLERIHFCTHFYFIYFLSRGAKILNLKTKVVDKT